MFTGMGPEKRRYKYRGNHSDVLLKIAVPEKFTKFLKSSDERAPSLVKLQARGDMIFVPIFASPLALRAKERLTQCDKI